MGVVEQTGGAVESQLTTLEESYGSFSIHQRTVTVSSDEYERQCEQSAESLVSVHAKVVDGNARVLHVDVDGRSVLPSTEETDGSDFESAAKAVVSDTAGIECEVTDLVGVTILGLREEANPDCETVYQLAAVFECRKTAGTLESDASWGSYDPESHPVYL